MLPRTPGAGLRGWGSIRIERTHISQEGRTGVPVHVGALSSETVLRTSSQRQAKMTGRGQSYQLLISMTLYSVFK